ncbi:MAG: serine/threonine-protein kinase [Gemmataceae bacterium]
MAEPTKTDAAAKSNEDRFLHALVSRGLVTLEEIQQCILERGMGPEACSARLVQAGYLTPGQAQRALAELPALASQQIPGYQLLERLGQGSAGAVFKARQLSMNRLVAIKILHPRRAADPEYLKRLTREAHLAAKLSHNNIIQAIDVGSIGKVHYFVMEHVEGTTLRKELEDGRRFSEREAVDIILQIAQALEHANRRGLLHRDVKPANIVLTRDGIAKLADLGMARDTSDQALARAEAGMTIGTPFYMAPEQIAGRTDIDIRADIYSLGATFYHLVTGQPPFPGKDIDTVLQGHLTKELTPPDHLNTELSSGLGEVVEFMMAKNRADRYQKPEDLILDLECLLNGDPPKLARQRIEAAMLEQLEEGEPDDEGKKGIWRGREVIWLAIVAAALGLSLLMNLVQFLRR